jgi:hypothetical protein
MSLETNRQYGIGEQKMASDISLAANIVEFASIPIARKRKTTPAERAEGDEALLDRISDLWNEWATRRSCPRVRFLTASRAAHCRRRIADLVSATGLDADAAFKALLAKCDESFLVKGTPRKPLAFDQLLQESFMVRMMEGEFIWKPRR